MTWVMIGIGGALGSMARHAVNVAFVRFAPTLAVPYATFTVNVIGCLVIGLLAGLVTADRIHLGLTGRAFLFVGVLGGFTTFSTFGLDTLTLARSGSTGIATLNVAGQVVVGLIAAYVGFILGSTRA